MLLDLNFASSPPAFSPTYTIYHTDVVRAIVVLKCILNVVQKWSARRVCTRVSVHFAEIILVLMSRQSFGRSRMLHNRPETDRTRVRRLSATDRFSGEPAEGDVV